MRSTKVLLAALACALLWAAPARASIAVDGTPAGGQVTTGTTLTISNYTCTTGSVNVVYASDMSGGAETILSAVYNSVSFTEVDERDNTGGVEARLALYIGVSGCDGAPHNLVITLSGSTVGYIAAAIVSYCGVENGSVAASHRTTYQGGAGGGGANITVVDSQSGDRVVGGIANYSGAGAVIAANLTDRNTQNSIGGGDYDFGFEDTTASGASTVVSWTGQDFHTTIATALIPSVGGCSAPAAPHRLMLLGVG